MADMELQVYNHYVRNEIPLNDSQLLRCSGKEYCFSYRTSESVPTNELSISDKIKELHSEKSCSARGLP